jgi:superfamily II DNA or RNA helicase
LAHNRNLLTYLHNSIQYKKIATSGFYLGGMKQSQLQETETKQIVIATYSMAAEALDIKTLSTLLMVTPKTDVIQSVGRILRTKHEHPIIVDFIDTHTIFQNQWKQRFKYYKKCNYEVKRISNIQYNGMSLNWNNETFWKKLYIPKKGNEKGKGKGKGNEEENEDEDDSNVEIKKHKCLIFIDP